MHYIRIYILQQLRNGSIGFADINQNEFRTDLFTYHLKALASEEYIEKQSDGKYRLTDAGVTLLGKFNRNDFNIRGKSDAVIIIVIADNSKDIPKYLFIKREAAPFIGTFGFVAATLEQGKDIKDIAQNRCKRIFDVSPSKIDFRYVFRNILESNDEILLDQTALIMYCEISSTNNNIIGEWFERSEIDSNFIYDAGDILKEIEANTSGLLEKTYQVSSIT